MEDLKLATDHSERLHNEDLAPVEERTWSTYSLFAMWMSDVHSIGEYTMAAGLFFLGLNGWQVFLALIIGITIVYFLMNLTGIAGQQYGIPYSGVSRLNAPNKTVVLTPADQGTPEIEERLVDVGSPLVTHL